MNDAEMVDGLMKGAQPLIERALLAWDGRIDDLAILIGVRSDGCGKVVGLSRKDLAKDLLAAKGAEETTVAIDVFNGKEGLIPVVFSGIDVNILTLVWMQPVSDALH